MSIDSWFHENCDELRRRLFPTEEREGPLGSVAVDASFLRDLLARYGSCRLWLAATQEEVDALRRELDEREGD